MRPYKTNVAPIYTARTNKKEKYPANRVKKAVVFAEHLLVDKDQKPKTSGKGKALKSAKKRVQDLKTMGARPRRILRAQKKVNRVENAQAK